MGDFNADPEQWTKEKTTKNSTKYLILEKLKNENFIDLQKTTNEMPLKHTWKNNNVTRRLDQIWVSREWTKDIYNCKVIVNDDELLETDHNIIIAKLLSQNTLDKRTEALDRRLSNKKRVFNYELMNKELWENYQKQLDLNLGELNINYELSKNHKEKKDLNRT